MSATELTRVVANTIERGRLLKRAGAATVGAVFGAFGLAEPAQACCWNEHGCALCAAPSTCPPGVICSWCWTGTCHACPDQGGANYTHSCCEGYNYDLQCYNEGCGNNYWLCSYYIGYTPC